MSKTEASPKLDTPHSTFPCDTDNRVECSGSWLYFANGIHQSCKSRPENCIYLNKGGAVCPSYQRYTNEQVARAIAKKAQKEAAESQVVGEANQGPHPEAEKETEAQG